MKTTNGPDGAELERLVRAAQAGRARAFESLSARLLPLVRRWALSLVASPDDAEDVAQEVLVKTHRSLGSFTFGSRFTTWAYSVTRHAAADFHRKRNRRDRLMAGQPEPVRATPADTGDPDRAALTLLVQQEFLRLPNRQREIFDLADLQGLAIGEISELLAMNAVTVRVHLHRARASIRKRLLESHPALVAALTDE